MRAFYWLALLSACGREGFGPVETLGERVWAGEPDAYCGTGDCALLRGEGGLALLAGSPNPIGHADGSADTVRYASPSGLAANATTLFVADCQSSVVRAVDLASVTTTTLAGSPWQADVVEGTGSAAHFSCPYGLALLGSTLYVTHDHVLSAVGVTTGAMTVVAGTPFQSERIDATGAAARFFRPKGLATDGTSLFVADSYNHAIRRVDIASAAVTTLAGGTAGSADGTGSAAQFYYPEALTRLGGTLYVADTFNSRLRAIDIASAVVTTVYGYPDGTYRAVVHDGADLYFTNESSLDFYDLGAASRSQLAGARWTPGSVDGAIGTSRLFGAKGLSFAGGDLFVSDTENHILRRYDVGTGQLTTFSGQPGLSVGWAAGAGSAARFYEIYDVATDGTRVFVSDYQNHTIRMIDVDSGLVQTLSGVSRTLGHVDGAAAVARFYGPTGLEWYDGTVYVAEADTVRAIDAATGEARTVAGTHGVQGTADGRGAAAQFRTPRDVAHDGLFLYVTDEHDHTVRRISPDGDVVTIAGAHGIADPVNGVGTAARFSSPSAIVFCRRQLFLVDAYPAIRSIDPFTFRVRTVAGSLAQSGSADGPAATARFSGPIGLACDGRHLYIADRYGSTVRYLDLETQTVGTLFGTPGVEEESVDGATLWYPRGLAYRHGSLFVANSWNVRAAP